MDITFNQKGFILPLTFMLSLLFPLLIFSELQKYEIEQRFLVEYEETENIQSLAQMGINDLYRLVMEESITEQTTGVLYYPLGSIEYVIDPQTENIVNIKGKCITFKQREHYFMATINILTNKIEKWVEG